MDDEVDRCPICPSSGPPLRPAPSTSIFGDELHWIACTKCSTWFHSVCILQSGDEHASTVPRPIRDEISDNVWANWTSWVDRWYCRSCIDYSTSPENPKPPHHPLKATTKKSTFPPRKETPATEEARPKRKAAENAPDYWAWNHGIASPTANWLRLIAEPEKFGKDIRVGDFPRLKAENVNKAWLDAGAEVFYGEGRRPMLIKKEDGGIEGLGGKVPGRELTVGDVAEQVGRNQTVDVIDVATQTSSQWNLGKWSTYFTETTEPDWNGKVYNIISLEITGTALAKKVRPPRIVREIDWVDNYWPFKGKEEDWDQEKIKPGVKYPKVQMYCLMGIRGSWTDWHVDFAASSVYYHIHTGAKEFYFIRPTEHNLKAYTTWSGSAELQQREWLGDMCEGGVEKVRLLAGDTMIIPAGYIHAVYTPANSIVFGGNFIHSYSIPTQLRLRQIEIDTKVPQRFRFPSFDKLNWYVADRNCADLRALRAYKPGSKSTPTRPADLVLRGLLQMAEFLQSQVDILEDETIEDKARKAVYDRVPQEVKDPSGLVKELSWRVRRELGDESAPLRAPSPASQIPAIPANGKKRKLAQKQLPVSRRTATAASRPWTILDTPMTTSTEAVKIPRPRREQSGDMVHDGQMQVDRQENVEVKLEDAEVQAERRVERYRQTRKREFEVDGRMVIEEQVVEFTETRTIVT